MENKIGFFEESPGQKSSNRLIFIVGFIWLFAIITLLILRKQATIAELAILWGAISTPLIGLKLVQKKLENKPEITDIKP
jgi:hypothetical protein